VILVDLRPQGCGGQVDKRGAYDVRLDREIYPVLERIHAMSQVKRILQEFASLAPSESDGMLEVDDSTGALPLSPDGAVFVRVDERRLDVCKVRGAEVFDFRWKYLGW
jgi:hypothetical protein